MKVSVITLAFGSLLPFIATAAHAQDTAVTCSGPVLQVNTGVDGEQPRFTIRCSGGSSAGAITYFAYRLSSSKTLPQLLASAFETYELQHGTGSIAISSNLNDTSGNAWGCGAGNCRIIDYLSAN